MEKEALGRRKSYEKESSPVTKPLKTTKPSISSSSNLLAPTGSSRMKINAPVATPGRRNSTGEATATPRATDRVRRSLPEIATSSPVKSTMKPRLSEASISGSSSSKRPLSSSSSSFKRGSYSSEITASSPSLSSTPRSVNRSNLSGGRKLGTPDGRDSRFSILPQIDSRIGNDVRLDLRGHRVRSLKSGGLNLSPNLDFVYLRDNLLSSVEGIEALNRVKVLDLSFNEFKGPGFEPLENCKYLQQLYLAGNQITSLGSLPALPNLEFLSVAQNKLRSLAMVSQPRLQVLAASKNKISTVKGFPYLPALEHLRIEENPILKTSHLEAACILLVGPSLKKFNDRDLHREEISISKRYPPCAAVCLRDGWEFSRPENSAESTFLHLREQWADKLPHGYTLKEASVDKPYEEDVCQCRFTFSRDDGVSETGVVLRFQWFISDRTLGGFTAVPDSNEGFHIPKREDIGRYLKVECTPVIAGTEYATIFAISSRISRGTRIPKVVKLIIEGELVEGNVIRGSANVAWCGGTPGKGFTSWLRRKWNGTPTVIAGADDDHYKLCLDDVGSCVVFMYTPITEEGTRGEPNYNHTDFIKAAHPSVQNVCIVGNAVEGNAIRGSGVYFGGNEGPSQFQWLRETYRTGELEAVSTGTNEYRLTKDDVGHRIVFIYKPMNFEGQEGEHVSVFTEKVKEAPPKVTNVKIIGELRENSKISVTGAVTGGDENFSTVQWYKTYSFVIVDGEDGLEPLSTAKTAKALRVPLVAVGSYIAAKYTPMSSLGVAGEPVYVISERTVETLPPSLNFLSITGDYTEGEILTASYGYLGGHEGKSVYRWYVHEFESQVDKRLPEYSGLLQYRIGKEAVGKYVSFECVPVREDGTAGEPRVCTSQHVVQPGTPKLLSFQLVGESVEGTTLTVDKVYWGGDEGDSIYQWFHVSRDGFQREIAGASSSSYELVADDIGGYVCVSCQPVRSDSIRGSTIISGKIGPVVPCHPSCKSLEFLGSMVEGQRLTFLCSYIGGDKGVCRSQWLRTKNGAMDTLSVDEFIDLSLADVGHRINLTFTPVRKDGVKGPPKTIVSEPIIPADPVGLKLSLPVCCEEREIAPEKRYFGGEEGSSEYTWCASRDSVPHPSNVVRGKTMCFTPSLQDVGLFLILTWLPVRSDGKRGLPVFAASSSPVEAAPPVVTDVTVEGVSLSTYHGGGKYFGGHEGSSLYRWHRQTLDGETEVIDGAVSSAYNVSESDYNCRLLFSYTPVRSDSVVGEERFSEPSNIVLPALLEIEQLTITGKVVEGHTLTAVEVIPKNASQQLVWSNYKNSVSYKWCVSSTVDDAGRFQPPVEGQSASYKIRSEDIGCCLKCECVVTDVFGRRSEPANAVTSSVSPGFPKMEKLEIEGRGFHTNLHSVRGAYSGGKEGKSRIQWLRSMVGSPDLISIPGEVGNTYEANVDDVGYRLVAVYTPIREDGAEGHPASVSTEPIAVEPDIHKEVKEKISTGSVKFETLFFSSKKVNGEGSLEIRHLHVNRERIKVVKPGSKTSFSHTEIRGSYSPPFHVEVFRNDPNRLRIVVDTDHEVDLTLRSRHIRDVIVLVIRGFAQKFNSTSLNTLLKTKS